MFLKKGLLAALLALVVVLAPLASFAAFTPKQAEESFKKNFPQIPVEGAAPTEIPGLFEMVSGQNVFYYYPEKELVITGEIIGKDLKSRTAEKKGELAAQAVKNLPLDKAVKVGNGKKVVIEFTDPDCPYCRKAADFLRKRTDLTRYVFFAPLAHPAAAAKIEYILGAKDQAAALEAMMEGKEIPADAPKPTDQIKALAREHMTLARKVGIQGTPTFFIGKEQVVGADTQKLEQLLK